MPELLTILTNLSWPIAICLAWVAGEFGHRLTGLPKITFYGIVGFILASSQVGVLPVRGDGPVLLLADVAFGLILCELGYRINLRWLRTNPWFGVAGLAEAALTFVAVYFVAIAFGSSVMAAMMLASLAAIGFIGFAFERLFFGSIEKATVMRWGMVRAART